MSDKLGKHIYTVLIFICSKNTYSFYGFKKNGIQY